MVVLPDEPIRYRQIVRKATSETVEGIAIDPVENVLYWTDATNAIIYKMSLINEEQPSILIKLDKNKIPHGIAIDICRRTLYWTSKNHFSLESSIEQISLDGTNHKVLIDKDVYLPRGIVVDQYSKRIIWLDDKNGHHFTVQSANLDGSDPKTIVRSIDNAPQDLTVDVSNVYWTDTQQMAVWSAPKNLFEQDTAVKVQRFNISDEPYGIIARNHLLNARNDQLKECESVINGIKTTYTLENTTGFPIQQCLNYGEWNPNTNICQCKHGFRGSHCEVADCFNYCIGGTCEISTAGDAQCKCHAGYTGDRCETDVCNNYCLNGGHCTVKNDERHCQCPNSYYGHRCEKMDFKEMCTRFCNKEDIDDRSLDFETVCK